MPTQGIGHSPRQWLLRGAMLVNQLRCIAKLVSHTDGAGGTTATCPDLLRARAQLEARKSHGSRQLGLYCARRKIGGWASRDRGASTWASRTLGAGLRLSSLAGLRGRPLHGPILATSSAWLAAATGADGRSTWARAERETAWLARISGSRNGGGDRRRDGRRRHPNCGRMGLLAWGGARDDGRRPSTPSAWMPWSRAAWPGFRPDRPHSTPRLRWRHCSAATGTSSGKNSAYRSATPTGNSSNWAIHERWAVQLANERSTYDPDPTRVRVPTLLYYGSNDSWAPSRRPPPRSGSSRGCCRGATTRGRFVTQTASSMLCSSSSTACTPWRRDLAATS